MPLPTRNKDEDAKKFVNRCMSNDKMRQEYPDSEQRIAVCVSQSRGADRGVLQMAGEEIIYAEITQEVADEKAGYPPNCNEGYIEKDGKCVPMEGASEAGYKYKDPVTGEIYEFARKGVYKKNGRVLVFVP